MFKEKNYETLNNAEDLSSSQDDSSKPWSGLKAPSTADTAAAAATPKKWRPAWARERDDEKKAGSALCPTCDGHGKVPKEKERHLVALIPADDDRLKPSRTKSYVLAAVVVSVLIAGLSIFFIYPRPFHLKPPPSEPELEPTQLYINTTQKLVQFTIRNYWHLTNSNYYFITLNTLNVQAYLNKLVSESVNETAVTVPILSTITIYQDLAITFKGDLEYLVKFCNDPRSWVHTIYMRFQATAVVSSLGYSFTQIAESYQRVSCGRTPPVTTTPKPLATIPPPAPQNL